MGHGPEARRFLTMGDRDKALRQKRPSHAQTQTQDADVREDTPMTAGIQTIIFPVKDLANAKALYAKLLGAEPYADAPYYVGFKVAGQDFGLDPNGHSKGMTGPVSFLHVDDIKASLQTLHEGGAQTVDDVRDVGNGRLIATVKDADGNVFGLLQDPK
jgi:predicted enzyme related to lactoylglutathione lyase